MRIALISVPPWAPTGYGVMTRQMLESLKKDGHETAVFLTVGTVGGGIADWHGTPCYPPLGRAGDEGIMLHAEEWKPDLMISIYDMWFSKSLNGSKVPWICWNPVDHDSIPDEELKNIKRATRIVSMSEFGKKVFEDIGIPVDYIPLGVPEAFNVDHEARKKFRQEHNIAKDEFLFGCVGANTFYPSRKGFDVLLEAFKNVHDKYPLTKLILHTTTKAITSPEYDIQEMIRVLGVPNDSVLFIDQYAINVGVSDGFMSALYNAMDCFVLPTVGEGFGLPVVEAQICGVPIIATNCTSMPELIFDQCGMLVEPLGKMYKPGGGYQSIPSVSGFTKAMIDAYENLKDRCDCHAPNCSGYPWRDTVSIVAKKYYWYNVYHEYWRPYLAKLQKDLNIGGNDAIPATDSSERTED